MQPDYRQQFVRMFARLQSTMPEFLKQHLDTVIQGKIQQLLSADLSISKGQIILSDIDNSISMILKTKNIDKTPAGIRLFKVIQSSFCEWLVYMISKSTDKATRTISSRIHNQPC